MEYSTLKRLNDTFVKNILILINVFFKIYVKELFIVPYFLISVKLLLLTKYFAVYFISNLLRKMMK